MTEEEAGQLYEWAVNVAVQCRAMGGAAGPYMLDELNEEVLFILNDRQAWVNAAVNAECMA